MLMTDDVVYDDAGWPTRMRGHAAVRGFLESTWRAVPDLSLGAWSMTLPTSCASLASCPGRGAWATARSSPWQTCRRSRAGAEHSPANPLLSLDGGSEALDGALEPLTGLARDRLKPWVVGQLQGRHRLHRRHKGRAFEATDDHVARQ